MPEEGEGGKCHKVGTYRDVAGGSEGAGSPKDERTATPPSVMIRGVKRGGKGRGNPLAPDVGMTSVQRREEASRCEVVNPLQQLVVRKTLQEDKSVNSVCVRKGEAQRQLMYMCVS